tara:strand:- start:237 stop:434 length:198 start_codon:yes stop_codon:yes gene_type:complete
MKIRAGCLIDYEVAGFKEAAEIETIIKAQVELIVARDPRVTHYDVGAKERRSSKNNNQPKFNDMK